MASLKMTSTFRQSLGRIEEGVNAGPTILSMGPSGSEQKTAGKELCASGICNPRGRGEDNKNYEQIIVSQALFLLTLRTHPSPDS